MRSITRHEGTLELIKRLPSSVNGNPRYLVRIDGYVARTAPNSSEAYGAVPNNFGRRVSCELGTHYGKTTIRNISSAEGSRQ